MLLVFVYTLLYIVRRYEKQAYVYLRGMLWELLFVHTEFEVFQEDKVCNEG